MGRKKMLISVDADESRVAIVDGERLENIEIETDRNDQVLHNIYKGVVYKVEPSLQAAFVDFGAEKQGFLPFAEVHQSLFPSNASRRGSSIQDVLKPGQSMLVQAIREEVGNKGATLTTHLSVAGRYLVLMPECDKTGISRKIPEDERRRLREFLDGMELPKGFGVIVRTAGVAASEEELSRDLEYLRRIWDAIDKRYRERRSPGLVFAERSLAVRAIRDYLTDDIEEVWIDNLKAYEEVLDFVRAVMPSREGIIRMYRDTVPLFIRHNVEDQIEEVFARKVPLPSGGSIVIDHTEALVAIDVNSGKIKGEDIEETAFLTNMEAAKEVARQVIMRDIGGIICIDFIDMKDRSRMRQVERALREAFRHDKARRKFSRISEFGLLEMSRQRLRSAVWRSSFETCPRCGGLGRMRTPESAGMYLLRRIRELAAESRVHQLAVRAPIGVANFLLNRKRRELQRIEVYSQTTVEVHGDESIPPTQAVIEIFERKARGRVRQAVQVVDLVRSEVVRDADLEAQRSPVVLRKPPTTLDFKEVYSAVERAQPAAPSPAADASAPEQEAASASQGARPAPALPPREVRQQKVPWWKRLFGVLRVDSPPAQPLPAPEAVESETTSRSRPASPAREASTRQAASRKSAESKSSSGKKAEGASRRASGGSGSSGRNRQSSSKRRRSKSAQQQGSGASRGRSNGAGNRDGARRDASTAPAGNQGKAATSTGQEAGAAGSSSSRRRRRRRSRGRSGGGGGKPEAANAKAAASGQQAASGAASTEESKGTGSETARSAGGASSRQPRGAKGGREEKPKEAAPRPAAAQGKDAPPTSPGSATSGTGAASGGEPPSAGAASRRTKAETSDDKGPVRQRRTPRGAKAGGGSSAERGKGGTENTAVAPASTPPVAAQAKPVSSPSSDRAAGTGSAQPPGSASARTRPVAAGDAGSPSRASAAPAGKSAASSPSKPTPPPPPPGAAASSGGPPAAAKPATAREPAAGARTSGSGSTPTPKAAAAPAPWMKVVDLRSPAGKPDEQA